MSGGDPPFLSTGEADSSAPLIRLQDWWRKRRLPIFQGIIVLMAAATIWRMRAEFYRLLWETGRTGAIDLKNLHGWVTAWFAGQPIYEARWSAAYPPASYIMLWPFLGWLSLTPARWLWAITSVAALVAIVMLFLRVSGAGTRSERWFVALLVLSLTGTAVTIGNGQLILHILPALLAAVLLMERPRAGFSDELIVAGLFTWTLVKPSVAAPFLWVLLFGWKRWRPALLVLVGYYSSPWGPRRFKNRDWRRCFSPVSRRVRRR